MIDMLLIIKSFALLIHGMDDKIRQEVKELRKCVLASEAAH